MRLLESLGWQMKAQGSHNQLLLTNEFREYCKQAAFSENVSSDSIAYIFCEYFQINKHDLLSSRKTITQKQFLDIRKMMQDHFLGKPAQYITKKTYFYEDEFYSPEGVFIPRPETELLIDIIKNDFNYQAGHKITEACAGTGCISLSLARIFTNSTIVGYDNSPEAVRAAKKNAKILKKNNVRFFLRDVFQKKIKKADIFVCNPPYIPLNQIDNLDKNVKDFEPHSALTDFQSGISFYLHFAINMKNILYKNGSAYFELPGNHFNPEIIASFKKIPYSKIELFKDYNSKERFLKIQIN
jgi:release factor glutamine methyltransferase